MTGNQTIKIATRGSALALAQANGIAAQCRAAFPELTFELAVIRTTGDRLQQINPTRGESLPKGLFTKELELAMLQGAADMAVHSLKDLPTELPSGLVLGAVGKREDPRDVFLYRDQTGPLRGFAPGLAITDLPSGAVVATSSTRRQAQARFQNRGLAVTEIRGNVLTRLEKLASRGEFDATILASAGLRRLGYSVLPTGGLSGESVPAGLLAVILEPETMLPCVGQGAIGIEIRAGDARMEKICAALNDAETEYCVTAERAFLAAMGGGCQSPVAALGTVENEYLRLRTASFQDDRHPAFADIAGSVDDAEKLGRELATQLKS